MSKLGDSEGEAAETQVWLQFALEFGYIDAKTAGELTDEYDAILGMLVNMITRPERWTL